MAQGILLKKGGGGSDMSTGFPPQDVSQLKIQPENLALKISWLDPKDTVAYGETLAKWKGTKVVYNKERFPRTPDDGTLIVDNQNRNYYSDHPRLLTNLENDTKYYITAFPYSDKDVYCLSIKNCIVGQPKNLLPKAKLADYSWNEISLISHLAEVDDTVWNKYNIHVGDSKPIVINGTTHDSKIPISGTWDCTIIGLNHNRQLEGPGITFSFPFKDGKGYAFGSEIMYKAADTNTIGWTGSDLRNVICPYYFNLLPKDLQEVIRTTTKYTDNVGGKQDTTLITPTQDKLFVASAYEMLGVKTGFYNRNEEKYQKTYEYYSADPNRIVKTQTDKYLEYFNYWTRSPYSKNTQSFVCARNSQYPQTQGANNVSGFVPCFVV